MTAAGKTYEEIAQMVAEQVGVLLPLLNEQPVHYRADYLFRTNSMYCSGLVIHHISCLDVGGGLHLFVITGQ